MLELAILADGGGLAVAVRLGAVDAERSHRALRQQITKFFADRDQRGEILDIFSGKGIFDHGDRGGAPRRGRDLAAHLHLRLFDDGDDLADDRAHASLPWSGIDRVLQLKRARSLLLYISGSDDKHITTKPEHGTLDQPAIE